MVEKLANVVIVQILPLYVLPEALDFAPLGGGAVKVKFEIPLRVSGWTNDIRCKKNSLLSVD